MNYKQKLKDPRWQKKRLDILKRDDFICQLCFDTKETLHVHHKYYNNKDPWDIPDSALVTLCATCHEQEGAVIKDTISKFKECIADCGGMSDAIDQLTAAFSETACSGSQLSDVDWVMLAQHIELVLKSRKNNSGLWASVIQQYFERAEQICNTSK